jgi:hypothetical protein
MKRPTHLITVLALALLSAGCAANAERQQMQDEELAVYLRHAGEPIDQIRSFRYIGWQPVGDNSLLLEARLNDWYLIEVGGPCLGLAFARTIGFRNQMNTLQAKFDHIIVDREHCQIAAIRPVDYKAARAEFRAREAEE